MQCSLNADQMTCQALITNKIYYFMVLLLEKKNIDNNATLFLILNIKQLTNFEVNFRLKKYLIL